MKQRANASPKASSIRPCRTLNRTGIHCRAPYCESIIHLQFTVIPKKSKAGIGFQSWPGPSEVINYAWLFLQWLRGRKRPRFIVCATSLRVARRGITNLFFNSDPLFSSDGNRAVSRIKGNAHFSLVYIALSDKNNNKAKTRVVSLWRYKIELRISLDNYGVVRSNLILEKNGEK